jgi:SAM-dependent methyltransferase
MTLMLSESLAMRIAGMFGLRKLRWSLRRLHVPVDSGAFVLEVGAGGNPYPRANVLLDGFEVSAERVERRLVNDRPLVLGFCENLPFQDKSFDFVIASHVLEHTDDPEKFLAELQRVAKAGYIETPDAFFERINPYTYHRLEVSSDDSKLIIRKKTSWKPDLEMVELYERKVQKDPAFHRYIRTFPDATYVRFYWSDQIKFQVLNPDDNASWDYPIQLKTHPRVTNKFKDNLRSLYLSLFRWAFSQNRRNTSIDVFNFLRCIKCGHADLTRTTTTISCNKCQQVYSVINGIPRMILEDGTGANQVRSQQC